MISRSVLRKAILSSKPYKDHFISYVPVEKEILLQIGFIKTNKDNNFALVPFGKNLTSNVGNGRFTKLISKMMIIAEDKLGIIYGILLSDGYLSDPNRIIRGKISNGNCLLGFKQSVIHFEYLWFVFSQLSHYCSSLPTFTTAKRNGVNSYGLNIQTRTLPCFTELRNRFYLDNVKVVPRDIYNILTPRALAHLIMGDGQARSSGLILCTDSFTPQDVVRLISVLIY
jgi:LAGLIDADG DNA endonuclease family